MIDRAAPSETRKLSLQLVQRSSIRCYPNRWIKLAARDKAGSLHVDGKTTRKERRQMTPFRTPRWGAADSSVHVKVKCLRERTRFLRLDHSSYMLKTPLGSMLRRVDDTKSWIGCKRKQSLRRPKYPASAVHTSRGTGDRAPPEATAPEECSGLFPIGTSCLWPGGRRVGVDLGLPFVNVEDEAAAAVRCMALFDFPAAVTIAGSWSAHVPPPVTKNVSSKTASAAGRDASICSKNDFGRERP